MCCGCSSGLSSAFTVFPVQSFDPPPPHALEEALSWPAQLQPSVYLNYMEAATFSALPRSVAQSAFSNTLISLHLMYFRYLILLDGAADIKELVLMRTCA